MADNTSTTSGSNHANPSASSSSLPRNSLETSPSYIHNAAYRPQSQFSFPPAAQPEIVRAYQKDTYYKDLFTSQVSDVVRSLFGTRVQHSHLSSISLIGSLGYYLLSTSSIPGMGDGRGGQTLGEEYVNAIPQDLKTRRIVTRSKRLAWLLLHVLGPYSLTKLYSAMRRHAIASKQTYDTAEQRARARARALDKLPPKPITSLHRRLVTFLTAKLPALETLQSSDGWLAYLSAAHLMLFYLGGSFYSAAQRVVGVGYISTIPKRPGYMPPSYEVLGVLLGIQLSVKLLLELRSYRRSTNVSKHTSSELNDSEENNGIDERRGGGIDPATTVVIDRNVFSHTSQPAKRQSSASSHSRSSIIVDLLYPHLPEEVLHQNSASKQRQSDEIAIAKLNTSAATTNAHSTLQCTLCMDQRSPHKGTSTVTECGHVFDWACINAWLAEKVYSLFPPSPFPI
uniref:RING-type E3 ubiquitin transferase n=1 Tax=Melanopsichium pennsylvanicum 4 TaxID=1398559 RepID=A0A077R8P7_9BASI|nr:related to PEX10-peroxisomal assembly protein-peroxin [Melanopsichium pennsylvanicum 4]